MIYNNRRHWRSSLPLCLVSGDPNHGGNLDCPPYTLKQLSGLVGSSKLLFNLLDNNNSRALMTFSHHLSLLLLDQQLWLGYWIAHWLDSTTCLYCFIINPNRDLTIVECLCFVRSTCFFFSSSLFRFSLLSRNISIYQLDISHGIKNNTKVCCNRLTLDTNKLEKVLQNDRVVPRAAN